MLWLIKYIYTMSNLSNPTSQTSQTSTTSTTSPTNDYTLPRKLRMEDLLDDSNNKHNHKNNNHSNNNHSNYNNDINKNQEDFGHKRRIKPWRTGTKSQQQIAPKGFKKGFRK